jgi:hypothetical protein
MKRPEETIHRAVVQHLQVRAMPGVFWFHPANGGKRTRAEAGIFKALGARAGLPDLIVFDRSQIFGLELKSTTGRVSPAQRQTLNDMEVAGARTHIAYSLDEALTALEFWGVLRRDVSHRVPSQFEGTAGE